MNKRKLIVINLISASMLTGCVKTNISEDTSVVSMSEADLSDINLDSPVEYKLEDAVDEYGFAKIKGYENLEAFEVKDDTRNSKYISLLSSDKMPSYPDDYYIEADKIKSLLGDNVELIKYEISSGAPELYAVKGYEEDLNESNKEQRYIYLNLQEKYDEDFGNPYPEKISFAASSSNSETALKSMLSMEDKIKTMLDNLLSQSESDEVLRFLKEEVSRINTNPKEESSFTININQDMYLEYIYNYSEEENAYYNRFSFICRGYINEQ